VDSKRLIEELNMNPELLDIQREKLQDVIVKNQRAFGLDDCLGHLDINILILNYKSLETRSKEVLLPPFHASPAN
jgi:hypothetical protein